MFPLRDVRRLKRAPVITWLLLLAMAGVFGWQLVLAASHGESRFLLQWGARPRCIVSPGACHIDLGGLGDDSDADLWLARRWLAPLVSSAFLHAGALHLTFNAWFLLVFGPSVEERLGRPKYLGLYLLCAVAAALAHVAVQPGSAVPLIGASGAIAGVLGAHLILRPRSWILSYIPPFWVVPMPSLVFLVLWMAGQIAGARVLLSGHLSGVGAGDASVAWAAHIGGFAFGAACAWRARPWLSRKDAREKQEKARSST